MCGIFGVLGLAGLDFFEAVKVVTLRLRLSRHNLGSSPAGTSRLRYIVDCIKEAIVG